MKLFFEGISFGLLLAILLGPIFVVTIHTALEKGKKAAFVVTSGVWISDLIFISASYFFVSKINHIVKSDQFDFWMSIIGGGILCLFGLVALLKKSTFDESSFDNKISLKSFSAQFLKGFLVNTVNPFTLIFWLGVMSSNVVGRELNPQQSFTFLIAIMLTIILTDSLKVLLADLIRKQLNQRVFNLLTKIAGIGIFIFGLYLLYRGIVN